MQPPASAGLQTVRARARFGITLPRCSAQGKARPGCWLGLGRVDVQMTCAEMGDVVVEHTTQHAMQTHEVGIVDDYNSAWLKNTQISNIDGLNGMVPPRSFGFNEPE